MSKSTISGNLNNITTQNEDEKNKEIIKRARYDRVFKNIMKYKGIAALVLKYSLVELKPYTVEEIVGFMTTYNKGTYEEEFESEIEKHDFSSGDPGEKLINMDLLFDLNIPKSGTSIVKLSIDMEMQGEYNTDYSMVQRGIYYAASLLRDTLRHKGKYSDIHKVYSIWFCARKEVKLSSIENQNQWFHRYGMMRAYNAEDLGTDVGRTVYDEEADLMTTIFIELPRLKENTQSKTELAEILDNLFNGHTKDDVYQVFNKYAKVNLTKTKKIEGSVTSMYTQEQVLEASKQVGRAEGMKQAVITCYNSFLAMHKDEEKAIKSVASVLKLSVEDVKNYIK